MKRDFDLIRKILLAIEEHTEDTAIQNLTIEGYNREQIAYHVQLIFEAGLVKGDILFGLGSVKPRGYSITQMTWAGHDFLDACRDESRWAKAKEIFSHMDGVTFDVAKGVLVHLMTTGISQVLPNLPLH